MSGEAIIQTYGLSKKEHQKLFPVDVPVRKSKYQNRNRPTSAKQRRQQARKLKKAGL